MSQDAATQPQPINGDSAHAPAGDSTQHIVVPAEKPAAPESTPSAVSADAVSAAALAPPPEHDAEAKGMNGTGLAAAPPTAADGDGGVLGQANGEAADVAPQSSHVSAAATDLAPETVPVQPTEPATDAAPGTANPFDPKEEADVGATTSSSADAHAPEADTTRPAAEAVDPAKENLISPVEVKGDVQEAPVDDVMQEASAPVAAPNGHHPAPIAETMEAAAPTPAADGNTFAQPPAKRQRVTGESLAPDANAPLVLPDSSAISMTPAQLKSAQNIIKSLKIRPEAVLFLAPVDYVALNIPHYPQIIQQPMDLGTIDLKLAVTAAASKGGKATEKSAKQAVANGLDPMKDFYATIDVWESDVRLVFSNCLRFNGPDHPVSASASALEAVFEKQLEKQFKPVPVEVPPPPAPVEEKKARRPSNPVPTIRRSSSDASGRPKREIHPPPPRDLPYGDEPQSASSGRKRKSNKVLTPRQQAHNAKVNAEELKYCAKMVDEFMKPSMSKIAWVFYDVPAKDLDFAPAYYETIKHPIALRDIANKLKQHVYEDKADVSADMKLMFANCYTFNAPDSDVYQMGKKLEAVFQDKMKKIPKPKPLTPEPEDEDDDIDAEDSEDERQRRIRELEEQLAEMRSGGAKPKAKAAATKKKPAKAASAAEGSKKKAPAKAKAAAASSDSVPKKAKKTKKAKADDGSDDEEDVRAVTWEQKEELAMKITQLTDERLDGALQIISEDKPQSSNDQEEIELDIDDLSPRTLYRLYRYVVKPKKKPGPKPGTAKGKSSKPAAGKKRKNLDEEEEAARIQRLQEQLQSFERGSEAAPPAVAAPLASGHDDLVQSESSSGEEESDGSESDY